MAMPPPGIRPRLSRRLLVALLASLLVHLVVLFGHRLDLAPKPDLQRLEARLLRAAPDVQPGEAPPPVPPPKPRKPKRPVAPPAQNLPQAQLPEPPTREAPPPEPPPAANEAVAESAPPAANEAVAESAPPAVSEAVAESAPSPAPATSAKSFGSRWPKAGQITFAVFRGERQFEIGRALHQWEVGDDGRYHITTTTETTGLAGFIRPVRITQASIGRLVDSGFRPETFIVRREGHEGALRADLDWQTMRIRMDGGEQSLPPGTQDPVSVFYQIGFPGYPESAVVVPIATARKLVEYRFEVIGEEMLDMPFGKTWRTLHVRARYEETTEVWLALDQFSLPVKIRHLDRRGDLYDQWAVEVLVAKDAVDRKNP